MDEWTNRCIVHGKKKESETWIVLWQKKKKCVLDVCSFADEMNCFRKSTLVELTRVAFYKSLNWPEGQSGHLDTPNGVSLQHKLKRTGEFGEVYYLSLLKHKYEHPKAKRRQLLCLKLISSSTLLWETWSCYIQAKMKRGYAYQWLRWCVRKNLLSISASVGSLTRVAFKTWGRITQRLCPCVTGVFILLKKWSHLYTCHQKICTKIK